jgi:predicted extracellular nuclease
MARMIAEVMGGPDVISMNENENDTVLRDVIQSPLLKELGYDFVVAPSNDQRGINVALLYRKGHLSVAGVSQFNPQVKLKDNPSGQIDETRLYARAPLVVDFVMTGAKQAAEGAQHLTVITNHFKSKLGGDGPEERRQLQGEHLGGWIDARRAAAPQTPVLVLGDLNAWPSDGAYKKLAFGKDGQRRLGDATELVPQSDRYSYMYKGQTNQLDHMLYSPDLQKALVATKMPHVNTSKGAYQKRFDKRTAVGVSDHDPIIAEFDFSKLVSPPPAPKP